MSASPALSTLLLVTAAPIASPSPSRAALWTSRVLVGLLVPLLAMDAVAKLVQPAAIVEGTVALGYSPSVLVGLGIALLASTLLYAVPRTSFLGAVLLTGYLGGAVATHVRVDNPLFSHTLFPIYIAAAAWLALVLRDARLRAVLVGKRP